MQRVEVVTPRDGSRLPAGNLWVQLFALEPLEYAVPTFLAASLFLLLTALAPTELHRFTDRTIGIAVLQAFDTRLRGELLILSPILAVLVYASWIGLMWFLRQCVERKGGPGAVLKMRTWTRPAHYISLFGIAALVFQTPVPAWTPICSICVGLAGYFIVAGSLCAATRTSLAFTHSIALAAAAIAAGFARIHYTLVPAWRFDLWAGLLFAVLWAALYRSARARRGAAFRSWVGLATIPLFFILSAPEVAQELAYVALLRWDLAPSIREITWILAIGALLLWAGTLLAARLGRFRRIRSCSWIVSRLSIPMLIATLGTVPLVPRASGLLAPDVHHWGEALIPLDQFLKFGSIPYIDLLPTHGVLSNVGPLLHRVLYGGYSIDEYMLGSAVTIAIGLMCAYYFLRRAFSSPGLAALLIGFLQPLFDPGLGLASPTYSVGLIAILAIGRAVRIWRRRAFLEAGAVVLIAGLFRADVAMGGALIAAIIFTAAAILRPRGERWLPLSFAAVLAAPISLCMLVLLFSKGGLDKIAAIRTLFSLDFQALSIVPPEFLSPGLNRYPSNLFLFCLFPASLMAGILLALKVLSVVATRPAPGSVESRSRSSLIWRAGVALSLVGYNLLIFHRVLERFSEALTMALPQYALSFSLVSILLCMTILACPKDALVLMWVAATLLTIAAVPNKNVMFGRGVMGYFDWPVNSMDHPARMNEFTARINIPAEILTAWRSLRDYINREVPPGDTFAELGNQPLLNVALNRPFPAFNMVTISSTGEAIQRAYLDSWDVAHVPVVVVHGAEGWLNSIDTVPDPVRNYRLHERLHEFYQRDTQVGPFVIYKRRDLAGPDPGPFQAAQLETSVEVNKQTPLVINTPGLSVMPAREVVVRFESRCAAKSAFHIGFAVQATPASNNAIQTSCGADGFSPLNEWSAFQVKSPLSLSGPVNSVVFTAAGDAPIQVRNIAVTEAQKSADLDTPPGTPIPYEVRWLPYVWGQFDPRMAATKRPVVWSADHTIELAPNTSLTWDVDIPAADSAYVRVDAESDVEGSLIFNYAKQDIPLSTAKGFRFSIRAGARATYLIRPSVQAYWFGDRSPVRKLLLWNNSARPVKIFRIAVLAGD